MGDQSELTLNGLNRGAYAETAGNVSHSAHPDNWFVLKKVRRFLLQCVPWDRAFGCSRRTH